MIDIEYRIGDATAPDADGVRMICHVCNDIGRWGKGFVMAVSKRWPEPEAAFRAWSAKGASEGGGPALGDVQFVQVEPATWVANVIGQHGIRRSKAGPPIRYEAIAEGLARVAEKAVELAASVHMPRIGCGLAGGEWGRIEPLIRQHLSAAGIPVTVYDWQ